MLQSLSLRRSHGKRSTCQPLQLQRLMRCYPFGMSQKLDQQQSQKGVLSESQNLQLLKILLRDLSSPVPNYDSTR